MPSYAQFGIFGKMFEVKLSSEMKSLAVAKDESILTAALRAGVNLSHTGGRGTCRICRATVAKGEVRQNIFRPAALPHRDREAVHVLLCCGRALSDGVIDAIEVDHAPELRRRVLASVVSIDRPISEGAVVTLRVPLKELFHYVPGQYIGTVGPDDFARAFSIANAPRSDRTIELHVGRLQNGFVTNHIYQQLKVGDVIRIETPRESNHLPADESRPLIAIVGGDRLCTHPGNSRRLDRARSAQRGPSVLGKPASVRLLRDACRRAPGFSPSVGLHPGGVQRESRRRLARSSWIGASGRVRILQS
jgi:CDP-4-dehydro-6-deoxyglucose reductase, E3